MGGVYCPHSELCAWDDHVKLLCSVLYSSSNRKSHLKLRVSSNLKPPYLKVLQCLIWVSTAEKKEEVFAPLYCLFVPCLYACCVFGVQVSEHLEEFCIRGIIIVENLKCILFMWTFKVYLYNAKRLFSCKSKMLRLSNYPHFLTFHSYISSIQSAEFGGALLKWWGKWKPGIQSEGLYMRRHIPIIPACTVLFCFVFFHVYILWNVPRFLSQLHSEKLRRKQEKTVAQQAKREQLKRLHRAQVS